MKCKLLFVVSNLQDEFSASLPSSRLPLLSAPNGIAQHTAYHLLIGSFYFKKMYLILERGEGREKEKNIDGLPLAHTLARDQPTAQACALTGS